MKLLPRSIQLALDVLQVLRHAKTALRTKRISEYVGEHPLYTARILRLLVREGYIVTTRQGYQLSPLYKGRNAADLLRLFERRAVPNPLRGDFGAGNRLLHKLSAVLELTSLDELTQ